MDLDGEGNFPFDFVIGIRVRSIAPDAWWFPDRLLLYRSPQGIRKPV